MKNKKLIGIGLSSLLATSCATFSKQEYSNNDQITAVAAITCQALDVGTTTYAINHGLDEANPLFGKKPGLEVLISTKLALLAVNYGLGELVPEGRPIFYSIAAGFGCIASGWNIYQISK